MEIKMREYRTRKAVWITRPENKRCVVFPRLPTEDIHHIRGRAGSLLLDERGWLPVSRKGHDWIEKHRKLAQNRGWLAGPGEWNEPFEKI